MQCQGFKKMAKVQSSACIIGYHWPPRSWMLQSEWGECRGIGTYACMHAQSLSRVQLFGAPWTVAHQAPLSMGFSRQEYWSGLHFLLQGIFPTQGLTCVSCTPASSGSFFTAEPLDSLVGPVIRKNLKMKKIQILTQAPHSSAHPGTISSLWRLAQVIQADYSLYS